jgi:hypothetical protein
VSNAVLATGALIDAATLSSTGTISAALPLTNLQTMQPGEVCRFTDLSGMMVIADLGATTAVNLIALINHNLTSAATWRIRAADTEANLTASPGYDSGDVTVWTLAGKPASATQFLSLAFYATAKSYRWWRIDITDAANPDGFVDLGRLYIDAAFQPSRNLAYGWGVQIIDPSVQDQSLGGQTYVTERDVYRVLSFSLPYLTEDEAYEDAYELFRARGIKKDVLAIRNPDATTHLHRQSVYGLLLESPPIVNSKFNIHEAPFKVKELLP